MKHSLLVAALFILASSLSPDCFAKAYFQTKEEMIERAEAIAIVSIGEVESVEQQGKHWTYRQRSKVWVKSVLKGKLPDEFVLYGAETFICAQCSLDTGSFIVFLKKDGDLWTGSNWHLSLRKINKDKVDWYVANDNRYEIAPAPLEKVIKEIKALASQASRSASPKCMIKCGTPSPGAPFFSKPPLMYYSAIKLLVKNNI